MRLDGARGAGSSPCLSAPWGLGDVCRLRVRGGCRNPAGTSQSLSPRAGRRRQASLPKERVYRAGGEMPESPADPSEKDGEPVARCSRHRVRSREPLQQAEQPSTRARGEQSPFENSSSLLTATIKIPAGRPAPHLPAPQFG